MFNFFWRDKPAGNVTADYPGKKLLYKQRDYDYEQPGR